MLCFRAPSAFEAVRRLRQGPLPPDADPQGGEGPAEAVPHYAERGSGREVDAHHNAPAGEPCQAFSGVDLLLVLFFFSAFACRTAVLPSEFRLFKSVSCFQ